MSLVSAIRFFLYTLMYLSLGLSDTLLSSQSLPKQEMKDLAYKEVMQVPVDSVEFFLQYDSFSNDTTHLIANVFVLTSIVASDVQKDSEPYIIEIERQAKKLKWPIYSKYARLVYSRRLLEEEKYQEAAKLLKELIPFFEKHKDFHIIKYYDPLYTIYQELYNLYDYLGDDQKADQYRDWCISYNDKVLENRFSLLQYQLNLYLKLTRYDLHAMTSDYVPHVDSLFEAYDHVHDSLRFDPANIYYINEKNYHTTLILLRAYHQLRAGCIDSAKVLHTVLMNYNQAETYNQEFDLLRSQIYHLSGDLDKAKHVYLKMVRDSIKSTFFLTQENIYEMLDVYFEKQGDLDSARYYRSLKDSILTNKYRKANVNAINRNEEIRTITVVKDVRLYWMIAFAALLLGLVLAIRRFPNYFMDFFNFKSQIERNQRKKFSTELHDNIGSLLTELKMSLENKFGSSSDIEVQDILKHMDVTLKQVRNLSHEWNDPDFENYSLSEIVSNYVDLITRQKTIKINSNISHALDSIVLSPLEKVTFFRITQEVINNIFKYSEASVVDLSLCLIGDKIQLLIEDNGKGFDVKNTLEQNQGIGLQNCLARAKEINASFVIESSIKTGSVFILQLEKNKPSK